MKITTVDVTRYAQQGASNPEILVVDVATDDGIEGRGYQMMHGIPGHHAAALLSERLAPCVIGADPWLTSLLWERMYQALPRRGGDGLARASIAAIDTALWDIKARQAGVPLSSLFSAPLLEEEIGDDGVYLKAPAGPGLGLALDAQFAAQHRVD